MKSGCIDAIANASFIYQREHPMLDDLGAAVPTEAFYATEVYCAYVVRDYKKINH